MYWCFHCYGINAESRGRCAHCGQSIEPPTALSYDQRLAWTLGHPDGDRAVVAARTLGERGAVSAVDALLAVIRERRDPFVAAEALRSLIKIEGSDRLHELLEELAGCDSFLVADVARGALGRPRER